MRITYQNSMKVKITYKQRYGGEILTDSYFRIVKDRNEIAKIENDLYSDPHVFSVEWEEVAE